MVEIGCEVVGLEECLNLGKCRNAETGPGALKYCD